MLIEHSPRLVGLLRRVLQGFGVAADLEKRGIAGGPSGRTMRRLLEGGPERKNPTREQHEESRRRWTYVVRRTLHHLLGKPNDAVEREQLTASVYEMLENAAITERTVGYVSGPVSTEILILGVCCGESLRAWVRPVYTRDPDIWLTDRRGVMAAVLDFVRRHPDEGGRAATEQYLVEQGFSKGRLHAWNRGECCPSEENLDYLAKAFAEHTRVGRRWVTTTLHVAKVADAISREDLGRRDQAARVFLALAGLRYYAWNRTGDVVEESAAYRELWDAVPPDSRIAAEVVVRLGS